MALADLTDDSRKALLKIYGAETAQSYVEVFVHGCLLALPSNAVAVKDVIVEGNWTFVIQYQRLGHDGVLAYRATVLDLVREGRFGNQYGSGYPVPPDPMRTGWDVGKYDVGEPLGEMERDLRAGAEGVRWWGPAQVVDDAKVSGQIGKNLSDDDISSVRYRIEQLDVQLRALDRIKQVRPLLEAGSPWPELLLRLSRVLETSEEDAIPATWLHQSRLRYADRVRVREMRDWLQSWL